MEYVREHISHYFTVALPTLPTLPTLVCNTNMDNQSEGQGEQEEEEDNSSPLDEDYERAHSAYPLWELWNTSNINTAVLSTGRPRAVREGIKAVVQRDSPQDKVNALTCGTYISLFKACERGIPDLRKPAEKYFLVNWFGEFLVLSEDKYLLLCYTEADIFVLDRPRCKSKTASALMKAFGGLRCYDNKGNSVKALKWFLEDGSVFMRKNFDMNRKHAPSMNALDQLDPEQRQVAQLTTAEGYLLLCAAEPDTRLGTDIYCEEGQLAETFVERYQKYQKSGAVANYKTEGTDFQIIESKREDHKDSPQPHDIANKYFAKVMRDALGGGELGANLYAQLYKRKVSPLCFVYLRFA